MSEDARCFHTNESRGVRIAGEDRFAAGRSRSEVHRFSHPPDFVVGYGLDVGQRHRNLPEVRMWIP